MTSDMLARYRSEYQRLSSALLRPLAPRERDDVRAAIITLFKDVDALLGELTTFKESIRQLVDVVNRDPRRSNDHATALTKICLEEIALAGVASRARRRRGAAMRST